MFLSSDHLAILLRYPTQRVEIRDTMQLADTQRYVSGRDAYRVGNR
jgi:hypothetical protein